jgi:hypothetical protein
MSSSVLHLAFQKRELYWSNGRSAKRKGSILDTIESAIALCNEQRSLHLFQGTATSVRSLSLIDNTAKNRLLHKWQSSER